MSYSNYVFGNKFNLYAQQQWAPTLTSHDPNPPITLEDGDSGPIGFGIYCNEFELYIDEGQLESDQSFTFYLSEEGAVETGPIGTGVSCLSYEISEDELPLDNTSYSFQLEEPETGPLGLGIACTSYEVAEDSEIVDESSYSYQSENLGPAGEGINCIEFEVMIDDSDNPTDGSSYSFQSENFFPPVVTGVRLRPMGIVF